MGKNNYRMSNEGIAMLVGFEGEILKVYKDPVGLATLGVGHLVTPAEKKDYPVGKKITRAESREFLRNDLRRFEDAVNNLVKVPITQNQFDALTSFAFNVGEGNLKKSSVLRNLNNRKFDAAANSFLAWNRAGGKVLDGLTRRRNTERSVFLTPDKVSAAVASASGHSENANKSESSSDIMPTPTDGQPDTSKAIAQPPSDSSNTSSADLAQQAAQSSSPAVAVQTVSADLTAEDKPTGIKGMIMAGAGILTSIGSGVFSIFQGLGPVITISFFASAVLIASVWLYLRHREKENGAKRKAEADEKDKQRAHELQILIAESARNRGMDTIALVPPPVLSGTPDPAPAVSSPVPSE